MDFKPQLKRKQTGEEEVESQRTEKNKGARNGLREAGHVSGFIYTEKNKRAGNPAKNSEAEHYLVKRMVWKQVK